MGAGRARLRCARARRAERAWGAEGGRLRKKRAVAPLRANLLISGVGGATRAINARKSGARGYVNAGNGSQEKIHARGTPHGMQVVHNNVQRVCPTDKARADSDGATIRAGPWKRHYLAINVNVARVVAAH